MINSGALLLAIGFTALGSVLWAYGWFHRINAWAFGAAGWFWVIAVVPWLNLLASWTSTPNGLIGLVFVDVITAIGFLAEAIHGAKYHKLRTPFITFTFGTALVLSVARWRQIKRNLSHGFHFSGHALTHAISRVQSGKAAAAVTPNNKVIYGLAAIGLIVLIIMIAGRLNGDKRRPKLATPGRKMIGGRPALPAGKPSGALPARPPAAAGRRR
jgi:hypothetical protein